MLVLRGKCLGVEHKKADERIDSRTGETREGYDYHVAHVLDGWEARQCRIDEGFGPHPKEGDEIEAEVRVRAYRRGQDAMLSLALVSNLKAPHGARVQQ